MDRSSLYCDMKFYNNAISDLTKALELKPNDPKIHYSRGLAFYKNEMFKEAINDFKISLRTLTPFAN